MISSCEPENRGPRGFTASTVGCPGPCLPAQSCGHVAFGHKIYDILSPSAPQRAFMALLTGISSTLDRQEAFLHSFCALLSCVLLHQCLILENLYTRRRVCGCESDDPGTIDDLNTDTSVSFLFSCFSTIPQRQQPNDFMFQPTLPRVCCRIVSVPHRLAFNVEKT